MEEFSQFGSRQYGLLLVILFLSRGMDFLSTRIATPNLILEGNPVARKLGWRWGIIANLLLCAGLAFWALPAIVISTTSILVAARNFQSAWLMASLGEHAYRDWHIERIRETSATLYLFCLFAQTALVAALGAALMLFSNRALVPWAIGLGIIGYASAVTFYTLLSVWRLRRAGIRREAYEERKRMVDAQCVPAAPGPQKPPMFFIVDDRQPQGK